VILSYGKIKRLGSREVADIFDGPVVIEEKIDGSQFSFASIGKEFVARSNGHILGGDIPKIFQPAYTTAKRLHEDGQLVDGWVYRGESLHRPKHNKLIYKRIPRGGFILWDIETESGYLEALDKGIEAERLGLEVVPVLFSGVYDVFDHRSLTSFLGTISCLGDALIEGIVIKNYARFDANGRMLVAKHVNPAFDEIAKKKKEPRHTPIEDIIERYGTWMRYEKAYQHLRDANVLEHDYRDISKLLKEVQVDVDYECEREIKDELWALYRKDILRGIARGVPDWYKAKLAEDAG